MAANSKTLEPPEFGYISRRGMLKASAALAIAPAAGVVVTNSNAAGTANRAATFTPAESVSATRIDMTLQVNGRPYNLSVDARTTVLDALRENLGMKGTKKGCDHGQCGACTVLIDGRRINACLTLAVMHDGQQITTIEGLAKGEALHPMQASFLKHDGFQCGYCTPGQICSSIGMLAEVRAGMPSHVTADLLANSKSVNDEEIRERMSGNICRCSAYPNIIAAIKDAATASTAVAI